MEKFGVANSQKYDVYAARLMPREEFFTSGHRSCQGCGEALAVRWVCKAIGKDAIIAHATGCMEIVSSGFPQTSWMHPWIHVAFENTSAVASGIESALRILHRKGKLAKPPKVVAMGGTVPPPTSVCNPSPGPWNEAITSPTSAGTTKPT